LHLQALIWLALLRNYSMFKGLLGGETLPFQARLSVSSVISGGTPMRTGTPRVPKPRFT